MDNPLALAIAQNDGALQEAETPLAYWKDLVEVLQGQLEAKKSLWVQS